MLKELNDFYNDASLSDHFPNVGLTRRKYIEQVNLAIQTK